MMHYTIKNLMCEIVRLFASPDTVLRVRYEDLWVHPVEELERIGQALDLPMETVIKKLRENEPFLVPHLLDGNRIRTQQQIQLKPDIEWQTKMSYGLSLFAILTTLPFFFLYGYWRYPYEK